MQKQAGKPCDLVGRLSEVGTQLRGIEAVLNVPMLPPSGETLMSGFRLRGASFAREVASMIEQRHRLAVTACLALSELSRTLDGMVEVALRENRGLKDEPELPF